MVFGVFLDDRSGPVSAHAVRDQQFELVLGVVGYVLAVDGELTDQSRVRELFGQCGFQSRIDGVRRGFGLDSDALRAAVSADLLTGIAGRGEKQRRRRQQGDRGGKCFHGVFLFADLRFADARQRCRWG